MRSLVATALLAFAVLSAPARADDIVEKVQQSTAPALPSMVNSGAAGASASTLPVPTPVETPFFADAVSAGKLPPVAERLPRAPRRGRRLRRRSQAGLAGPSVFSSRS